MFICVILTKNKQIVTVNQYKYFEFQIQFFFCISFKENESLILMFNLI